MAAKIAEYLNVGSFLNPYFYNYITLKVHWVQIEPAKSFEMKKSVVIIFLLFSGCGVKFDPTTEEKAIRDVLKAQENAWNAGNIDEFMEGYWKSDSLMFIGSSVRKGWKETLEGYKKGYPNREAMGQLDFTFYEFRFIDNKSCLITGRYHLKRINDDPTGMFTLLLKKIDNKWVVVYDHTS